MILIRGQGIAGTILGWEFEQAGIEFAIDDRGHAGAASVVAAGIINPITGQRLVKSWRVETLLPAARSVYRAIEAELGVPVWREMRVRRLFANERERAVFAEKNARGELAPFAGEADEEGFWIGEAARVDFRALLTASRERWERQGRFTEASATKSYDLTIDCTGVAMARGGAFEFVPWEFSKGEMLEIAVEGLSPEVILNRRQWIVPIDAKAAWVGATHEPGMREAQLTESARALLEGAARELLGGRTFAVTQQRAGVRVNLPDKWPVVGRHPEKAELGLINGLAAKGALWAPMLARQWVNHLTEGVPFEREVEVGRFQANDSVARSI
jgi:glycine/D-amino acid oxidase-like deaminating enzyme